VTLHTGAFTSAMFEAKDLVVCSPGIALSEPEIQAAIARGISVVGDVELFAQFRPADAKVIAITGANGKTTVTTLVGEMCKAAGLNTIVAGNIGLPGARRIEYASAGCVCAGAVQFSAGDDQQSGH